MSQEILQGTVQEVLSRICSFWTTDMEWTARRRCFGADIFKFPAPT